MTSPPVTPAPAATVLLVRDGATGLEVFMLKRHIDSDFVGGAYVFPGGKVDDADLDMPEGTITPGLDEFGIAGVRETFEESGVLLAHRNDVAVSPELTAMDAYQQARRNLASRDTSWDWRPWLIAERLTLDRLAWYAWWVTPAGVHRRFDTRFYIAACPAGQVARHDGTETTDSKWIRPAEALTLQQRGDISIILPTRKILAELAGQYDVHTAITETATSLQQPTRIEPTIELVNGEAMAMHWTFAKPESV